MYINLSFIVFSLKIPKFTQIDMNQRNFLLYCSLAFKIEKKKENTNKENKLTPNMSNFESIATH